MFNSLFCFPYYKVKILPNEYDKDSIVSTILSNYSKQETRNKWNKRSNLHHEYNDRDSRIFEKIDYSSLFPVYRSKIEEFISLLNLQNKNFSWSFDILNYTVTTKNQNMTAHHHIPSVFTAVHYVKFNPSEHQPTLFTNPSNYSSVMSMFYNQHMSIFDFNDGNNTWILNTNTIPTEEDDFIIVPSIIDHSIAPSSSKEKRITIALNIDISKKVKRLEYL